MFFEFWYAAKKDQRQQPLLLQTSYFRRCVALSAAFRCLCKTNAMTNEGAQTPWLVTWLLMSKHAYVTWYEIAFLQFIMQCIYCCGWKSRRRGIYDCFSTSTCQPSFEQTFSRGNSISRSKEILRLVSKRRYVSASSVECSSQWLVALLCMLCTICCDLSPLHRALLMLTVCASRWNGVNNRGMWIQCVSGHFAKNTFKWYHKLEKAFRNLINCDKQNKIKLLGCRVFYLICQCAETAALKTMHV